MRSLYGFMVIMWAMIVGGGGIAVIVLGPISAGEGQYGAALTSVAKGGAAIGLVIAWVYILSRLKNWVFARQVS